jgi:hypothetical protein
MSFVKQIYFNFIRHCQNSDILLQSVKFNRIYPTARRSGAFSLGILSQGTLDPIEHPASNRSFIFSLASPLLVGNKDDHSLRLCPPTSFQQS